MIGKHSQNFKIPASKRSKPNPKLKSKPKPKLKSKVNIQSPSKQLTQTIHTTTQQPKKKPKTPKNPKSTTKQSMNTGNNNINDNNHNTNTTRRRVKPEPHMFTKHAEELLKQSNNIFSVCTDTDCVAIFTP